MKRWTRWKTAGIIVLAGLVAIALYRLFFTSQGMSVTDTGMRQLSEYLRSFGLIGCVIGALLIFVQAFVPFVPFLMVAGVNVMLYPSPWGFVVNYAMSCLGAVATFLLARHFGHDWVTGRLGGYPLAIRFNKQMEKNGFLYVLIGRLIPVIPSTLVSVGAGVTRVNFTPFLLGTLIGKLPMVFLESQVTSYLLDFEKNRSELLVLLIVLAALMVAGNAFRKRLLGRK